MKTKIKIIQGDCLEKLKLVKDKSIDLAIIDPPYIMDTGGGSYRNNRDYVKEIDPIRKGFNFTILELVQNKLKKINLYIFCNKNLLVDLINYYSNKGLLLDVLVWHKTNPSPLCGPAYLPDLEYVLFIREKGVKINGTYKTKTKLYSSPTNKEDKNKYNHPTPKPVKLLENYIINSSNEGDTILDCFMGSGSTGEACVNTNRSFIGIELNEDYFKVSEKRIKQAIKNHPIKGGD